MDTTKLKDKLDGKACYSCPFNDFGSKDGESTAKAYARQLMDSVNAAELMPDLAEAS